MPQTPAIETLQLAKTYDNGVDALRDVTLEVRSGEIFCLLGPNGAGKTTLSRILSTQLAPSRGNARLLGLDLRTQTDRIRERLASVPQQSRPYYALQVWEQIFFYLVARGESWAEARRATHRVAERLGLADKLKSPIAQLSGGQRQRVLLCMALASRADLLLLDEPTTGLDILIRREFWNTLAEVRDNRTIFMTTHSMEEAEALADRLGIVCDGGLVAVGTPNELRALAPGTEKIVLEESSLCQEAVESLGYLQPYAGKWVVFPRDQEALRSLLDLCLASQIEASVLRTSLEDVFVYLVGAKSRQRLGGA